MTLNPNGRYFESELAALGINPARLKLNHYWVHDGGSKSYAGRDVLDYLNGADVDAALAGAGVASTTSTSTSTSEPDVAAMLDEARGLAAKYSSSTLVQRYHAAVAQAAAIDQHEHATAHAREQQARLTEHARAMRAELTEAGLCQ